MKFEFVPKICKGDDASYEGSVSINVPKANERHNYIRQSGVVTMVKGAGEEGGAEFDLANQYDVMTKMMGFVEKHIVEVNLVRKSDGFKIGSPDEFLSIKSCETAVLELVGLFMRGFEPGKNSEA